MDEAASELPTVATIIGCPEQLADTNGLVATPIGVPGSFGEEASDDAIQKALLENMCGAFMSKKDKDQIFCNVCKVNCTGENAYKAHVSGSKHAKKLKEKEADVDTDTEPFIYEDQATKTFDCTLCNIKLNAKNQIAAHISGSKHQTRLTSNEKIYSAAPRPMPYRQDMSANLLYCATCDVHANSALQMEQHMASAKHVNKVNGNMVGPPGPGRRPVGPPGPGGPPGRFMPYPYRDRDPYYEYEDERDYYRNPRDYDYPRGGGWARQRYDDSRYDDSRYDDSRYDGPPYDGPRYNDLRIPEQRFSMERYRDYYDRYEMMNDYRRDRPPQPSSRYGSMGYSY